MIVWEELVPIISTFVKFKVFNEVRQIAFSNMLYS